MVMTLIKGPVLFGVSGGNNNNNHDGVSHVLFGSIFIFAGCLGCAIFVNLQAITLKSYPATLSLTSLVCLMGAVEGLGMTFIMEETHFNAAWLVFKWDMNLLSAIYAGIVCSGIGYFLEGVIMKEKGPVFLTTFNPLCMVIAAVVSFFLFGVEILLGRAIGAFIVCLGLFSVVWGKSGDINNSSRAKDEMNSEELKEAHCENSGDELRETHRENSGDGLRETHRESSGDEITVELV
ncbi:WAT1-related protein At2g37460-like [Vicia villosa]|uniref:WAT1-related protein At2g37460-like n=1 Tax=Vicia villosa TaxID=3911 RepID=UPI00273CB9A9|nr:WAT1-related protein At2g37460-like [Vicia villosa]